MSLPDGPYVGVVDRFEEDDAVVLLERDGNEVGDVLIPGERLPHRARRQDAIVRVVLREGDVAAVWYDSKATRDRGASAQARFDRIAQRAPKKGEDDSGDGNEDSGDSTDDRSGAGGGDDSDEAGNDGDRDDGGGDQDQSTGN